MRVRINAVYLAPGGDAPTQGLSWDGAPSTQRSDAARGQPRFYDRKARSHTMAFGVTRKHASLGEAEAFIMTHTRELDANATGTITVLAESDSGSPAGGWTAPGRVTSWSGLQRGVSTEWNYQIEFGEIS